MDADNRVVVQGDISPESHLTLSLNYKVDWFMKVPLLMEDTLFPE